VKEIFLVGPYYLW